MVHKRHVSHTQGMVHAHGTCFPHTCHVSHTWAMFPTHRACFSDTGHFSQTQGKFLRQRSCFPHKDMFLTHGMFPTHRACFIHMWHVSHTHGMFLQTSLQFFPTKFIDKIFQKFMHHMWETCPICGKHDPCLKNMLHVWET